MRGLLASLLGRDDPSSGLEVGLSWYGKVNASLDQIARTLAEFVRTARGDNILHAARYEDIRLAIMEIRDLLKDVPERPAGPPVRGSDGRFVARRRAAPPPGQGGA